MKSNKMIFVHKQNIDGEIEIIQRDVYGEIINEELVYEYIEDGKTIIMRFLVDEDSVLVRLQGDQYQAVIPLELHQKTKGKYLMQGRELVFDFFLKKIAIKSLAIYLEYDIFTKDSVISNNTWEIEVK